MHSASLEEVESLPGFFLERLRLPLGGPHDALLAAPPPPPPGPSVHVVLTSNGNPYMNWQTRVMYATYKSAVAREPAGGGPLGRGAFTRVLHRSTDDELMAEVPTARFTPVHVNCDQYCSFPVADRAPALLLWMATPDARRCSHLLLVETDYLFVAPLAEAALPAPGSATAFPFSYVVPTHPSVVPYARKYYKGRVEDVPATGNAPVLLAFSEFEKIMPEWVRIVADIEADPTAVERLGWIRDMYAWSFAAAAVGVPHTLAAPPDSLLMVQPPADSDLGRACLLHYTWGPVLYNGTGFENKVWQFDKREYTGGQYAPGPRKLERIPDPPAWDPSGGLHLQEFFAGGQKVTQSGLELMRLLVTTFNAAVDSLPELPAGWTDRAEAEAAARPSAEAVALADTVQREIEAKERDKAGRRRMRGLAGPAGG